MRGDYYCVKHGAGFVDQVVEEGKKNLKFRQAIHTVWQARFIDPAVVARLRKDIPPP
jgi:hypothetical protein